MQLIESRQDFSVTTGQLTKLLKNGVTEEVDVVNSEGVETTETVTRGPTLEEVMLDPDFLLEMKQSNEALAEFFTRERVLEMCDFLIVEPVFTDSPERCFQLPQLACECFTSEQITIIVHNLFDSEELMMGKNLEVVDKLNSFFHAPDP